MSAWSIRILGLAMWFFAATADAHEGEDHHEHQHAPEPVLSSAPVAPEVLTGHESRETRLALSSQKLELVAVRDDDQLVIYLDDYASNAPLDGLSVEVVAGSLKIPAVAAGEGRYLVPAKLFDPSASRPVSFLVRGLVKAHPGEVLDERLDGVLPAGDIAPATAASEAKSRAWTPLLAIPLVVAPLLAVTLRRRRKPA